MNNLRSHALLSFNRKNVLNQFISSFQTCKKNDWDSLINTDSQILLRTTSLLRCSDLAIFLLWWIVREQRKYHIIVHADNNNASTKERRCWHTVLKQPTNTQNSTVKFSRKYQCFTKKKSLFIWKYSWDMLLILLLRSCFRSACLLRCSYSQYYFYFNPIMNSYEKAYKIIYADNNNVSTTIFVAGTLYEHNRLIHTTVLQS